MHPTDRTRVRVVQRLDGECRLQSVLRCWAPVTAEGGGRKRKREKRRRGKEWHPLPVQKFWLYDLVLKVWLSYISA